MYKTFTEWKNGNWLEDGEPRKEAYTRDELLLVEMGWKYGFDAGKAQQADRIAELEKDFAWAKDQWNKDRICFESRRNELEKDLALKTRDRDVFSNFTLAYEERIAELEELLKIDCDEIKILESLLKEKQSELVAWWTGKYEDEGEDFMFPNTRQAHIDHLQSETHKFFSIPLYTTPQTKPLSNDEIREIGDDCELKNNGILNWIEFARAIEERHKIK